MILFLSFSILCFADTLFEQGNYRPALTEYKRLNFFSPTPSFNRQIGLCYEKLENLENAIEFFEKAKSNSDLLRTYLKQKDYSTARFICEDIPNGKEITGWIYIMENRWDDAISSFSGGNNELKKMAIKGKNLPYKSETSASILSAIIPGTGEMYSHGWIDGLLTFSLNTITGGLAIKSFTDKHLVDGTLITVFLWNRFYFGGIENARKNAIKYNEQLKQNYLNQLKTTDLI